MRHRHHSLRLSQKPHHAWMIQRNLVTSLLLYERVRTTKKRALVIRPLLDRLLSIGKMDRPDLAIRRINEVVTDENACRKILEVFRKRYAQRSGGYSRLKPVGMRKGDGARLVDIVLVDTGDVVTGGKKEKSTKSLTKSTNTKKKEAAKISSNSSLSSKSSLSS